MLSTFQVTSTLDTAPAATPTMNTLRWAVQQADEAPTASTITFSLGSKPATITLMQGELDVDATSGSITIQGPGAGLLSISGNHMNRVFDFYGQGDECLSGLTITNGLQPQTQDGGGGGGGGLYNGPDSTLSISDCTITGNSAADFGGGVDTRGVALLNGCTISGNSAFDGGGVYGSARLTSCTISGNSAGNDGGGFENSSGTQLYLADSTISGNTAANGGGVYGFAALSDCTISGNKAGSNGGGLFNASKDSTYLGGCTVSGNSAEGGGGLYTKSETTLTLCTISGNSAVDGGGLENGGAATIQGCTIGGNSAGDEYGGLMNFNGSAQLTDTIVAGNILPPSGFFGDNIADIGGSDAGAVTGSNNLIGTGGSGGIRGGTAGNIVLTSLTGLGLAPLANYGGPTMTVALLPGSPALGSGTAISGLSADQRGEPIGSSVDIGAFQSQGFTLAPAPNSTPQGTIVHDGFADPLAVTVTPNNPVEPVAGGMLTYSLVAGADGASGTLSAATATIGSGGSAQVTAMAGSSVGTFTVNATSQGATGPARFQLSNLDSLSFSGLQDPVITYGTPSVTFSGTLSNGSMFPPAGEDVAIALDGVTQQATIGSGGTFATTFATAGLAPTGSPYTVSYTYAGDATYIDVSTISTLTVTKATPTVSVSASPGTAHLRPARHARRHGDRERHPDGHGHLPQRHHDPGHRDARWLRQRHADPPRPGPGRPGSHGGVRRRRRLHERDGVHDGLGVDHPGDADRKPLGLPRLDQLRPARHAGRDGVRERKRHPDGDGVHPRQRWRAREQRHPQLLRAGRGERRRPPDRGHECDHRDLQRRRRFRGRRVRRRPRLRWGWRSRR